MLDHEAVRNAIREHGGLLTRAELRGLGLHSRAISGMVAQGSMARVRRGIYEWIESDTMTDLELMRKLIPDGVLCLQSALYCYGYTDRVPEEWDIAVDRGTSRKRFALAYPQLHVHYMEPHLLRMGATESEQLGSMVRIFDRDRTVCDVIRFAKAMDQEVVSKAVRAYVRDPKRNVSALMDHSKLLHIHGRVRGVVGLWL